MTLLDPHGQPVNVRFNRARRAERDLSELLGLAKGLLADGVITSDEAAAVLHWVLNHPDSVEQWPVNILAQRLQRLFADNCNDEEERLELADLLTALVGGNAGAVFGQDAATELPVDDPPPIFAWEGALFVFTGKLAFGTRAECQREVLRRGATCEANVTQRTTYVVIGTFGSRDWIHTSFGRKIEKAVEYRTNGVPLAIVAEEHWAASILAAV
jgi:hypothetical protein